MGKRGIEGTSSGDGTKNDPYRFEGGARRRAAMHRILRENGAEYASDTFYIATEPPYQRAEMLFRVSSKGVESAFEEKEETDQYRKGLAAMQTMFFNLQVRE